MPDRPTPVAEMTTEEHLAAAEALDRRVLELRERIAELEQAAALHRALGGWVERRLKQVNIRGRVNSTMQSVHRLAISAGRDPGDPFLVKIRGTDKTPRNRRYSLRSLALALGISPSTLAAHRMPKSDPNHRPISQKRADKVEELTGWPADGAHWPAGIA